MQTLFLKKIKIALALQLIRSYCQAVPFKMSHKKDFIEWVRFLSVILVLFNKSKGSKFCSRYVFVILFLFEINE